MGVMVSFSVWSGAYGAQGEATADDPGSTVSWTTWALTEIRGTLVDWGFSPQGAFYTMKAGAILAMIVLSLLANWIAKGVILVALSQLIERTQTLWDDILLRRKVLVRLSHIAPALVISGLSPIVLNEWPGGMPRFHRDGLADGSLVNFVQGCTLIYMTVIVLLVANSFLSAVLDIYRTFEVSKNVPLKGIVQALKIVVLLVASVVVLSIVTQKSPFYFLTGLGAFTAVLLLIFKDTILGLVAGIQLSTNDMVRRGDWIAMPQFGADGDVLDVSLTTVKVQNWDKTISTIPTYAFISQHFKNWRGMSESGGRRIKRAIYIDMNSIKFCDEEMLERYRKIQFISEYVQRKKREIAAYNEELVVDDASLVNGRRLTNLGTFRVYIEEYLRHHPEIHKEMTFLVRQLAPGAQGLPIEIYVFSRDQVWARYEGIQADIFDHLLAVVPEFDLRVYQHPTGADVRALVQEPTTS